MDENITSLITQPQFLLNESTAVWSKPCVIRMFHKRKRSFQKLSTRRADILASFPLLLVDEAVNTMPDSTGNFQNALWNKQLSALEESGFLSLRKLNLSTCLQNRSYAIAVWSETQTAMF